MEPDVPERVPTPPLTAGYSQTTLGEDSPKMWMLDVPLKRVDQVKLGDKLRVVFGDEDYEVQVCGPSIDGASVLFTNIC